MGRSTGYRETRVLTGMVQEGPELPEGEIEVEQCRSVEIGRQ